MIISHKHKFIFFESGKTGTTSIGHILRRYASPFSFSKKEKELYDKHIPPIFLKKRLSKKIWKDYFKFAFVRNPWDWVVSQCAFERGPGHKLSFNKNKKLTVAQIHEMRKLMQKKFRRGITWHDYVTQYTRLSDRQGKILVDFVGRYENLQGDFDKVCDKIGIPRKKLPHLNPSSHKHYSSYYNKTTKDLVNKLYKKDIEYFGYEFEKISILRRIKEEIIFKLKQLLKKTYRKSAKLKKKSRIYSAIIAFIKQEKH
jgi:hypothetical protein